MIIYLWFISAIGIIAGFFLGKYTKEELKDGEKYFIAIEKTILFILIIFLLYIIKFNPLMVLFSLIGALTYHKIRKIYFNLGLIFILINTFILEISSLIFMFGLPYGSRLYYKKEKKEVIWSIIYLLIPLILLTNNISYSINQYLLALVFGSISYSLIKYE